MFRGRRRRMSMGRSMMFNRRVRRVVRKMSETKYVDFEYGVFSVQAPPDPALVDCLANIANGTGRNQKVGLKIFVRYLRFNILLDTNGQPDIYMRMSLVQAKTNGLTASSFLSTANGFWDLERFNVISDQWFNMGDSAENGMDKRIFTKTFRVMKTFTYDSTTAATPFLPLYLVFYSNDSVVPSPTLVITSRITFNDL